MHRLKNRGIVVLTVLGLFALSGIAMADTEDDTVFNYGYDEDSDFFMWNVTSLEYETGEESIADLEDCKLQPEDEDTIIYEYGVNPDDSISLNVKDGDPVDFEQLECNELSGGSVLGPQQQLNHGMFLKLFNSMYDGTGNRGCIVRHIARSDLGIADPTDELGEGEVSFTTIETNCLHGPNHEDNGNGDAKGKPDWAGNGKPDWAGNGKPDHAGGPGGP